MGTHIHNLAQSMIGQLGIGAADINTPDDWERPRPGSADFSAMNLYERRSDEIKVSLRRMRPETLGRIAAQGKGWERPPGPLGTPMYLANNRAHLDMTADGRFLLIEIACAAIVAEMADILRGIKDAQEIAAHYA